MTVETDVGTFAKTKTQLVPLIVPFGVSPMTRVIESILCTLALRDDRLEVNVVTDVFIWLRAGLRPLTPEIGIGRVIDLAGASPN